MSKGANNAQFCHVLAWRGLVLAGWMVWSGFVCAADEGWPQAPLPVQITTFPEDTAYLQDVLEDAFSSIYFYRNPVTGLCSDFPDAPNSNELIKTEHIFLSLTSVAVAGKIGLISDADAVTEIDKTLDWIEVMRRNQGFFWVVYRPVDATTVTASDPVNSVYNLSDYGWCYCALATVGEIYPQFRARTSALLGAVEWSAVYQAGVGVLALMKFNDDGTVSPWGPVQTLTGDNRPAMFMAVASGLVPVSAWTNMSKNYVERYGVSYFKPGEAMGYGEQPMAMGYFLDERGSEFGWANANLGWGQINYAQDLEFPAWGWSSCRDIDGYLGWGTDQRKIWSRVNTHAVAAQVCFYPNQVAAAFRAMERLGLRQPITTPGGQVKDFGLRDSIDVDTRTTPEILIPGLDQCIVFLSLANYLYDGMVWRYFMKNDIVQQGLSLIPDYRNPQTNYLNIYRQRDLDGPALPPKPSPRMSALLVDDFSQPSNALGGIRSVRGGALSITGGAAQVDFFSDDDAQSLLTEDLNGADLAGYNAVKLVLRAEVPGDVMVTLHLGGEGGYLPVPVSSEWTQVVIPFRSFMMGKEPFFFPNPNNDSMRWTAMWHDRSHGGELGLGPNTLRNVDLNEIAFLSLSPEAIRSFALELRQQETDRLAAPTDLAVTSTHDNHVVLTWCITNDPATLGHYNIIRNGEVAALATSTVFTNHLLEPSSNYVFQVCAVNRQGRCSPTGSAVAVTTLPHRSPPGLVSVDALSWNQVRVAFTEAVEAPLTVNAGNFTIDQGVTVLGSHLSADRKSVVLDTTFLSGGTLYSLIVHNAEDLFGQRANNLHSSFTHDYLWTQTPWSESYESMATGMALRALGGWSVSRPGAAMITSDPQSLGRLTNAYASGYPIHATHTQMVWVDRGTAIRWLGGPSAVTSRVDFLMEPVDWSWAAPPAVETNDQVAFYLNTSGYLVMWHGYFNGSTFSNRWTELLHTPVQSPTQWIRLTLTHDYSSALPFFKVQLNGGPAITHALAYSDKPALVRTGEWFLAAVTNRRSLSAFSASGCMMDDLVVEAGSAPPRWTITLLALTNGTIISTNNAGLVTGQRADFTVQAARYFHIADVRTNGESMGAAPGAFTWNPVLGHGSVRALFAPDRTTNTLTPVWWIAQHYGETNFEEVARLDTDGDGFATWEEQVAGTEPTNRASVFCSQVRSDSAGGMRLCWPSADGRCYDLEMSADLLAVDDWSLVEGGMPATPPMNVYTVSVGGATTRAFKTRVKTNE
ncbi:MAG: hypothetical protein V2A34_13465 [Lentisphaerota bacterium]